MPENNEDQPSLFDMPPDWTEDWAGMPEFEHKNLQPKYQIIVSFKCAEDIQAFAKVVEQPLTRQTQSIWFPPVEIGRYSNKRYADKDARADEAIGQLLGDIQEEVEKRKEEPPKDSGPSALEYLLSKKSGDKDPDLEGK